MCLITIAYRVSERFPIVVAANRDEYHARAAAPADWWPDAPDVLGGRDLVAGGSWLAMERSGRVAAVTNRAPPAPRPAPASRGTLVADFLTRPVTADAYAEAAAADTDRFGPFNLVLLDSVVLRAVSNTHESVRLASGVRSFGNGALDAEWPKLTEATAGVARAIRAEDPAQALLDVLGTRRAEPPATGPDRENLFIVGPTFGTRCSTVILVDGAGRVSFIERRFDADARPTGEGRFEFELQ